jgi:hypothetical protein
MMNGSNGIQPVVELATNNNGAYPYPVYPMMNGGNGGFGYGGDWIWVILLLALFGGNWGNGNGGFFNGGGFDNGYAWLSNGQKEIMQNTNNGFDTLHLSNQLDTVNSGIYSLSNQLCNCCADMNSTVSNGFYNAEIAAANRQMANMNQNFALSQQLSTASADNRLGIANLNSTILSENCADRAALADGLKDVLINQTANTQRILDQLCNDKIDAKNEKILDLQRQLDMADLKASQIAQNAFISQGFANEVDALYNRLSNCPVPSTPVYGRTPIFTCPANNGCGCGFNTTSQFI